MYKRQVLISGPQYVEEGNAAQAPAVPDRDGYRFTGWDKDFSRVTGDMDAELRVFVRLPEDADDMYMVCLLYTSYIKI